MAFLRHFSTAAQATKQLKRFSTKASEALPPTVDVGEIQRLADALDLVNTSPDSSPTDTSPPRDLPPIDQALIDAILPPGDDDIHFPLRDFLIVTTCRVALKDDDDDDNDANSPIRRADNMAETCTSADEFRRQVHNLRLAIVSRPSSLPPQPLAIMCSFDDYCRQLVMPIHRQYCSTYAKQINDALVSDCDDDGFTAACLAAVHIVEACDSKLYWHVHKTLRHALDAVMS